MKNQLGKKISCPNKKSKHPITMYRMGNSDPSPFAKSFLSLVKLHAIVERVIQN